jgi:hypothetical protein
MNKLQYLSAKWLAGCENLEQTWDCRRKSAASWMAPIQLASGPDELDSITTSGNLQMWAWFHLVLATGWGRVGGLPAAPERPPEQEAGPGTHPGIVDGADAAWAAAGWQIEGVDVPHSVQAMGARSLALDTDGHPHIAYGGDHLYHAWHDGSAWHIETVDSAARVGIYTSLALDADGRLHISYQDRIHDDLKYARYDGAAWQIETVDSEGDVGRHTSLALDGAGRPHISYCDESNIDLKYAWWQPPYRFFIPMVMRNDS